MQVRHNPRSFLTGDDPFLASSLIEERTFRVERELVFEQRHEGFIGIPHGGLAMGLCIDSWWCSETFSYPIHARFRFGGSGLRIGERAKFTAEGPGGNDSAPFRANITREEADSPYLRAEISPAACSDPPLPHVRPQGEARLLPYYKNCFVCGSERSDPGLERRFALYGGPDGDCVAVKWGDSARDRDKAGRFLIDHDELHPAVLLAILDENTAWRGFLQTKSAGLSARMEVTLFRPVRTDEPLLFIGIPKGIRGNRRAPRFFSAEGHVLSMKDPASPEVVAWGKGDWIIIKEYTEQIKNNLLPEEDREWIFGEGDG